MRKDCSQGSNKGTSNKGTGTLFDKTINKGTVILFDKIISNRVPVPLFDHVLILCYKKGVIKLERKSTTSDYMQRVSESYRKTASLQKTAKYGCCDPMEDLLKVLCCVEEEYIEMAEIMEQSGKVEKAAKIYYKYGYDQKYIDCLQKRLAKNSNTYMELIDYYSSHDCYEKAVELAWLALEKCKDYNLNALIFCR